MRWWMSRETQYLCRYGYVSVVTCITGESPGRLLRGHSSRWFWFFILKNIYKTAVLWMDARMTCLQYWLDLPDSRPRLWDFGYWETQSSVVLEAYPNFHMTNCLSQESYFGAMVLCFLQLPRVCWDMRNRSCGGCLNIGEIKLLIEKERSCITRNPLWKLLVLIFATDGTLNQCISLCSVNQQMFWMLYVGGCPNRATAGK